MRERSRLTEIDGAGDREDLLFGEPVVEGDVADVASVGETNAGGGEDVCRELHGRVCKVRPVGEECAVMLAEGPE